MYKQISKTKGTKRMKKMIRLFASVATCLLFGAANGDEFTTGTSFEGLEPGAKIVSDLVNYDDNGSQSSPLLYWYSAARETDELGSITNYPTPGTGVPEETTRPDNYVGANNAQYLSIDSSTSTPIARAIKPWNTGDGTQQVEVASCKNGIFLDTLVKFTAADGAFKEDLKDGDKIAIEYVEQEAETNVVGDVTNIVDAVSGFVVRAGYMGTELVQTNYLAAAPAGFAVTNWYRLTVRTVSNIDGKGQLGFKIYLNENELSYRTDDARFATAAGDSFVDETRTIFPSVLDVNTINNDSLSAVAFSGNGCIDDVTFTTEVPNFIKQTGLIPVTVTLDSGVTNVTLTAGEFVTNLVETGTCNLPADARNTGFVVSCGIDTDAGYQFAGITNITAAGAIVADGSTIVIGDALSIELAVLAKRNNVVYYIDGDDDPHYSQSLAEAFANAKDGTTITLAYGVSVEATEASDFDGYYISSKSVVLDLNGQTITWNDPEGTGESLFNIETGAELIVIDSSVSNTGTIVYGGEYGAFYNDGDCYVGAASGDYGPTIEGILYDVGDDCGPQVVRGKFDKVSNSTEDDPSTFIGAAAYIESGSELVESLGDYWVVAPAGGSTTFALTTTGGANATVTTSPADVSALTEATEVTITATAAQDYTYDGVDLSDTDWTYDSVADAISMTTNISENTEIAVPNAVAEQSSDDWPTGQDLDDAEGQAAGDLFPGITNALATADAKAVATWAEANSVAYAAKGSILPEAFLLNCANTQEAIDAAAANFKITAITVDGSTITIEPTDGADYGNGKVVIEGTATLSPISWHEKTAGDHFFRATLVVKPVAVP